MGRAPAIYRPMTEAERVLAIALRRCSLPPASFTKRFARELAAQAEQPEPRITEKQLVMLFKLARRFRRQIRSESIALEHRFLLDKSIPLPEAPLPLVRSDENGSRSDGRRETPVQPDPVRAGPGQLSLDHIIEATGTKCERFHSEGSEELARTLYPEAARG